MPLKSKKTADCPTRIPTFKPTNWRAGFSYSLEGINYNRVITKIGKLNGLKINKVKYKI